MKRKILLILGGILLAACAAGLVLYRALGHTPDFYRKALAADTAAQHAASDQMLQRATALASDVNKPGRWQAIFTAEEINGYLAVQLAKDYPGLLPTGFHDPRIAITPQHVALACRYEDARVACILSLTLDVYLAAPNVIALRIRRARAGAIPLPLDDVLRQISRATEDLAWRVQWRQAEGDPVAQVHLPMPRGQDRKRIQIDTLRLGEGEIYVSGRTLSP